MWHARKIIGGLTLMTVLVAPVEVFAAGKFSLDFPPPKMDYAKICKPKKWDDPAPKMNDAKLSAKKAYQRANLLINGTPTMAADPHRAAKLLERVIQSNNKEYATQAKYQLAKLLKLGHGVQQNKERATKLLKEAYQEMPGRAGNLLGALYRREGRYKDAERYYQTAAANGHASAYIALSYLYKNDRVKASSENAANDMLALGQNALLTNLAKGKCNALHNISNVILRGSNSKGEEKIGLKWLRAAVASGDREAIESLAHYYYEGTIVPKNISKAVKLWEQAAKLGDNIAMARLGSYYLVEAEKPDYKTAEMWLKKASDYNHQRATRSLIRYYQGNYGTMPQYDKAFALLAQQVGKPNANTEMIEFYANLYHEGKGTEVNHDKAFYYYERAAKQGSSEALVKLGDFYKYGIGTKAEPMKSYRYYRLAANQGNKNAMHALFENYQCGIAQPANEKLAKKWQQMAVYSGSSKMLKQTVSELKQTNRKQDQQKILELLERSAKKNNREALAHLYMVYQYGLFGEKASDDLANRWLAKLRKGKAENQAKGFVALGKFYADTKAKYYSASNAVAYLKKAKNLGSIEGMYQLANLYSTHEHQLEDWYEARALYKEASDKGHIAATFKYGRLLLQMGNTQGGLAALAKAAKAQSIDAILATAHYYADLGDEASQEKAKKWLAKANRFHPCKEHQRQKMVSIASRLGNPHNKVEALEIATENGDTKAMVKLANYHFSHQGEDKAIELLKRAATRGNARAMVELGNAYAAGLGVPQSMSEAKTWWENAANMGNKEAKELLEASISHTSSESRVAH